MTTKRLYGYDIPILLLALMISGSSKAQESAHKTVFTSRQLAFLEFRNDSTLVTDLTGDWDTAVYLIRSDTLFIRKKHWETGSAGDRQWVEWLDFPLLARSTDTVVLLRPFRGYTKPEQWEDTVTFVRLEKLRELITSFGYIRISSQSPLSGTTVISIDTTGQIEYYNKTFDNSIPSTEPVIRTSHRLLSKKEFIQLKTDLSYALPSRLPRFRGGCGAMDAGKLTIEIRYNNRTIRSVGCDLQWPHEFLVGRIYYFAVDATRIK